MISARYHSFLLASLASSHFSLPKLNPWFQNRDCGVASALSKGLLTAALQTEAQTRPSYLGLLIAGNTFKMERGVNSSNCADVRPQSIGGTKTSSLNRNEAFFLLGYYKNLA